MGEMRFKVGGKPEPESKGEVAPNFDSIFKGMEAADCCQKMPKFLFINFND